MTSGSSKPARPPSPPRKERSLHLTKSAQRHHWRSYRRCVHSPVKKYPHFLPIQRRRCPTKGGKSRSDRWAAIMCRPIKAHVFTLTAEMQGPNSTDSPRTIGSFFRRKKKSSPCGPYFFGTIPMRGCCAQTHAVPRIQTGPNTIPHWFVPHLWHHA